MGPAEARRGRLKLAALGALFALPVLLAWLFHATGWRSGSSANYGELLAPRPLAGLAALRGKWVLVQFDAAACGMACERKLYVMRQVRKAQGDDQQRVERLWLLTDGAAPGAPLLAAIEGTRVQPLRDPAFAAQFPGPASAFIYLVDPLGNLMMRFPADPDPARMVKDLQRLLKYSGIG